MSRLPSPHLQDFHNICMLYSCVSHNNTITNILPFPLGVSTHVVEAIVYTPVTRE